MEKHPLETLKDLFNSIRDLFMKDSNVIAQVVVSKIKKMVEQWQKDLKEDVVRPFGEEEIDVTMYGAHRELRENFTRFLDLLGKAGDVENQVALSEKVKGIDDEVRRLNQQREKIKDEKTRELVGMTAMELSKEKEELTLKFEKEMERIGAGSIKFKNVVFTVLKTIEAGPSSISQVNLLNAVNGLLEDYPYLENEQMLVDLLIAGRGEKVVYKEKLEKEEPEGIVPMEKEKRIPEKVWEERRESVNFDTIYGALDWITDIGEKMTRAITWLKNKARGVFDWIRDSGSAIHETADGIDQLTGALENVYNEYSATGTVEGRLATEMRNMESDKEFEELAKRFGARMDENVKPRRRGKPLTDEERLERHKGLYPGEGIESEEELPERGTGLRGGEIEKRRRGKPLTDRERLKRHEELYPGEELPERGTGLRKEKKWKVGLIDEGKSIDKIIVMGPKSNKTDVIEQLKREGIGGEIISIQDVTEWQLSDEEMKMIALKRKSVEESEVEKTYDIFEFCKEWEDSGYGVALVCHDEECLEREKEDPQAVCPDKVIDPYVDPSDYPDMILDSLSGNAEVISPEEFKGCELELHGGGLEEKFREQEKGSSKKLAEKELGWWGINFTIEPNENDLSHVAELIKREYTEGEMIQGEKRGWWKINYTIEPNEIDLEHIAEMIKEGYTEGEMVQIEEEIESSKKLAGEFGDFYYVTINELDNGNLEIFPKETFKEDDPRDIYETFEDVIANTYLDWIAPEDLGWMTDAPLLGEVDISDQGEITEVHNIWYFPNYAVVDPFKELREGNSIVFEKVDTTTSSKKVAEKENVCRDYDIMEFIKSIEKEDNLELSSEDSTELYHYACDERWADGLEPYQFAIIIRLWSEGKWDKDWHPSNLVKTK